MFSKACEYGIRATLFVAMKSLNNQRVNLKEIAREIDSPEAFTAKILQKLTRDGIIDSVKGVTGGFAIPATRLSTTLLSQVVSAIDGELTYKGCVLGLKECTEVFPCPAHHRFKLIREELKIMLEATSILDLANGLKAGSTFLKREQPACHD